AHSGPPPLPPPRHAGDAGPTQRRATRERHRHGAAGLEAAIRPSRADAAVPAGAHRRRQHAPDPERRGRGPAGGDQAPHL
ncbi:MAG: hypothetical protein AVDCRST_MAG71-501, partial [uncultured Lysobacter sp.]